MKKNIRQTVSNIYKVNLAVKKNEKVLIFTDDLNKELQQITEFIAGEGKKYTSKINYLEFKSTGSHGAEPPEPLWTQAFGKTIVNTLKTGKLFSPLLNKRTNEKQTKKIEEIVKKNKKETVNAVIALSYYSTSHTKFRDLLTNLCGTRYASMPIFDMSMFKTAMRADYKKMEKRTKKLAREINKYESIDIKTPNGTFLYLSKKGRSAKADTGIITRKGSFSNLPAGEVFLAPLEGTANGKLVLEWAPTRKLKNPVTLYIENGRVRKIQGHEQYVNHLKTKLSERPGNKNIAELGIGTNNKATRPDNILESEKIMGTIHIALGDNSTFGGKVRTPFHQDFIFFKPTVTLISKDGTGRLLLNSGKIVL
ncbi:MAG: aminopeptidase [Nitrospirae bacterium]|nr:aminopeptidase [Nitrospirota bacterium]